MPYLVAAVVVVGLLCVLDLVMTVGVVRRLRQHTEHLNGLLQARLPAAGIPAGERVGDFAATTTDGEPVARDLLTGRTLVGFFSPGCAPCQELLPKFVDYAGSLPQETHQVLAVINTASADDAADYAGRLDPVARVVIEEQGPLQSAFQVSGFPTVYLLEGEGTVLASGFGMDNLAEVPEVAHDR